MDAILQDLTEELEARIFEEKTRSWSFAAFQRLKDEIEDKFLALQFHFPELTLDQLYRWEETTVTRLEKAEFGSVPEGETDRENRTAYQQAKRDLYQQIEKEFAAMRKPPSMLASAQRPDPETVLRGLDSDGPLTRDRLLRHYRKLALLHHPDQGGDPDYFIQITAAKDKLLRGL